MRPPSSSRSRLCQLSGRGVALPNTATAPSSDARFAATVRASYRGSDSCLYDGSCSSSTQIRPSPRTGAKIAERAPTTTRASPLAMRSRSSRRSASVSPEWMQRDARAEAGAEAPDRLRRQRDLRHEHDRAEAALERRAARLEVHLGLAAARRAVEQEVPAAAGVERADDGLESALPASPRAAPARARPRAPRARPAARARRAASAAPERRARARAPASSRSSRRPRARARRAAAAAPRRRARPRATSTPAGASTPSSTTSPRRFALPKRTSTTEPTRTSSGTSYVNGRARARAVTSG